MILKKQSDFTNFEMAQFVNRDQEIGKEAFFERFRVIYRSHLAFQDIAEFKKILTLCPWTLKKSFLGQENRELADFFIHEISEGKIADVAIHWIDETFGYGLFANSDLPAGTFIGEFTGVVRQPSGPDDRNAYCFHYPTRFWSWDYFMIDALYEGNETRFINHSDTPNLKPLCLCKHRLLHIVFVADRDIKSGTELTYNYGKDFWIYRTKSTNRYHEAV